MPHTSILHLIIGKWRTPNHATQKQNDDTHEVKKEILRQVGKKNFSKEVGANPDIGISEDGFIILKGTGDYKKKPYYVTEISAGDYFILRFVPIADSEETEIQVLTLHDPEADHNQQLMNIVAHFDRILIIPNNENVVLSLVDSLTEEYLKLSVGKPVYFFILLSDLNSAFSKMGKE